VDFFFRCVDVEDVLIEMLADPLVNKLSLDATTTPEPYAMEQKFLIGKKFSTTSIGISVEKTSRRIALRKKPPLNNWNFISDVWRDF